MYETSKLLLVYVLVNLCLCQQRSNDTVDYFKLLQHAHQTNEGARKYSREENISPTEHLHLTSKQNEVIARAEEMLASGLDAVGPYDVSGQCLNHTKLFIEALTRRELWAFRMIDAMGKPESDLLDFHTKWVGNWEECLSVQAIEYVNPVTKTGPSYPYTGKYCIASFPLGSAAEFGQMAALMIGMCYPDSCSSADATALAKTLVSLIPVNATIPVNVMCREKSLEYSSKAIAVIVICSLFAALIVIATGYDIFVQQFLANKHSGYTLMNKGSEYGSIHEVNNGHLSNGHVTVVTESTPLYTDDLKTNDIDHSKQKMKKKALDGKYQPGTLGKLLLSFSVYSNAPKIFNTYQPAGTLTSVNGIRFVSMAWVILGHTYAFGLTLTDNVATYFPQVMKRFTFQAVSNATVSVDTFFVLSGLLVSYLSLREMKKVGGARRFKWGMFYFHRFWRLTPPYMLLLMLYVPTFKYWADGPFWPQTGVDVDECKDTWWTNLLYINNIVRTDKMCMGWSWYLANDMQFYVLSPIMLIPLYYSPLWGTISCLLLILVNFISTGILSKHYDINANLLLTQDATSAMQEIYFKPWARIGPYVIGFFTGYLLYITECKVKMSKLLNIVGWLVATGVALLVLYGLYTPDGSPKLGVDTSALYNATFRTAWGMCVAWVIFACASGYGGPVNKLLSWRAIIPLSRLTYCAYLVHPLVLYTYYSSRRSLMRWYDLELIYLFLGHLCVSYAAAFIISLAFESPMMGLEKVMLGRKKNS
ncbi:nose resistant to fluoxetine protein 6-like [Mercenaria mercenaria]|uniref:nose resistant to fluoxetine protein 6-like n=1 Tax=Mercenaria mercenaria TaxID=6596 RepID=UPI00234F1F0C|nr:nose resistant to fluoxetine protein 6-like [Mercenaria mercenaria]